MGILTVCLFARPDATIDRSRVPETADLLNALDESNPALHHIIKLRDAGSEDKAIQALILNLKEAAAERYYFNWKNFRQRFESYHKNYPRAFDEHRAMAKTQMSTFPAETQWRLPFKNLKGESVTAYELRHLSRQQKSADMTLMFYLEDENRKYPDYFVRQVADLNRAFAAGQYDDAGNGVYEYYRAGKRMHNWLFNHHAYLASAQYTTENQLLLIKTFLHHGAQLQWRTRKNNHGNHHTKGLVAMFEIASLFPEFSVTEQWRQQAIKGLLWHITTEVNPDGFQHERSVHYHMGDIENYFRVYQLARINGIDLPGQFISQFKKMFTSLVKLAQPNRRLPVLQDDTDAPYAENNDISGAMTIGTLLFHEPDFRYFAGDVIPYSIYWLLARDQLEILDKIQPRRPEIGSTALPQTGYYTMRSGWDADDLYMTISAGLSETKPDHQHGDMLGVVAYANGREILPNYQVRYKHPEYPFFKNSWVKNVALADSLTLSRGWQPNRGKSGFGKWRFLARPEVINWQSNDIFDYFCGTHNGFDSIDVKSTREVLFIKDGFWLVRDHFQADKAHRYQQVWQGDFEHEQNFIHRDFDDGTGLHILQMSGVNYTIRSGQIRHKHNAVFEVTQDTGHTFNTLIIPYKNREQIKMPLKGSIALGSWRILKAKDQQLKIIDQITGNAEMVIRSGYHVFAFDLQDVSLPGQKLVFGAPISACICYNDGKTNLQLLGRKDAEYSFVNESDGKVMRRHVLRPGEMLSIPADFDNSIKE